MTDKELWFNVVVCDYHWHQVAGDRNPVRITTENNAACVKCGAPCPSPIYARASLQMGRRGMIQITLRPHVPALKDIWMEMEEGE